MTASWIDIIGWVGWIGAVLLLTAYVLVATRRLAGHSTAFHVLNLVGGAGLATNSAVNRAFPSAALNGVWMAIGVLALARGRCRRARPG
jgi:drug/metabolite transporter (DMT)-like permease